MKNKTVRSFVVVWQHIALLIAVFCAGITFAVIVAASLVVTAGSEGVNDIGTVTNGYLNWARWGTVLFALQTIIASVLIALPTKKMSAKKKQDAKQESIGFIAAALCFAGIAIMAQPIARFVLTQIA